MGGGCSVDDWVSINSILQQTLVFLENIIMVYFLNRS